jgi:uncharacterized cupredoxin-like copper-binding protein
MSQLALWIRVLQCRLTYGLPGFEQPDGLVAGSHKEGSHVPQRILVVAFAAMLSAAFLAACGAVDRQAADDANDEPATEVTDTDDAVDDAVDDFADDAADDAVDDDDGDVANGEQVIDVVLEDHEIDMDSSAQAGDITFEATNDGSVPHGIVVQEGTDGEGEFLQSLTLDPGESGTMEINLEAGDYTIFCPMGEHRDEHGMELEFTVEEDDAIVEDDDDEVDEVADAYDVTLSDHEIDMPEEVSAGDVTFDVTNDGEVPHGIAIEDEDGELIAAITVEPGETESLEATLEEGAYTVFCPIGEHREDHDMEVELTVTEDDAVTDDVVAEDSFEIVLDDYEIDMPEEVSAGEITFEVSNEGDSRHGVAFQELDEDGEPGAFVASATLSEGESTTIEVDLEEGEYIVFCPIGEHREDHDMEVELTVTADDAVTDDDDDDAVAEDDDDAVTEDDDETLAEGSADIVLTDYEIDMPEAFAAGEITFEISNEGDSRHGIAIQEVEDGEPGAFVASATLSEGESTSLDVELEEGEYIVFCPIGEHREDHDMELELTVE